MKSNQYTKLVVLRCNIIMAVASGPAGPVLAAPVLTVAFTSAHAQVINNTNNTKLKSLKEELSNLQNRLMEVSNLSKAQPPPSNHSIYRIRHTFKGYNMELSWYT